MSRKSTQRRSLLAASVLLAASASSYAGEALDIELPSMRTPITPGTRIETAPPAADRELYAAGEAMAPEVEARIRARMMGQGHGRSTDEVRQELAAARQSGTLSAAGEISDTAEVLQARADFNLRQTREILARHERERQPLAGIQAVAIAPDAAASNAGPSTIEGAGQTLAAAPQSEPVAPSRDTGAGEPVAAMPEGATPASADAPAEQAPEEPVTVKPREMPVNRVDDLTDETAIDTD